MIEAWNRLEKEPLIPETVLIQAVLFNRYIKIGNKPIKNFLKTPFSSLTFMLKTEALLLGHVSKQNFKCHKIPILNGCKQLMQSQRLGNKY